MNAKQVCWAVMAIALSACSEGNRKTVVFIFSVFSNKNHKIKKKISYKESII